LSNQWYQLNEFFFCTKFLPVRGKQRLVTNTHVTKAEFLKLSKLFAATNLQGNSLNVELSFEKDNFKTPSESDLPKK
jgi:hypothetical protein